MSKIDIIKDQKIVDTIDNKITELNKHIVIVDVKYIDRLKECGIPFSQFQEGYYIVKQGKKPKKFNEEQVQQIKQDLDDGLSIRKAANKHKCSTRTIQDMIKNIY